MKEKIKSTLEYLFALTIISLVPILTLICFWNNLFSNLFYIFLFCIEVLSIILIILYRFFSTGYETDEVRSNLVFTILNSQGITHNKQRYILRPVNMKQYWEFFVVIEYWAALYLLYVPSCILILFSQRYDIYTIILLIVNIFILISNLSLTIVRVREVTRARKSLKKEIGDYVEKLNSQTTPEANLLEKNMNSVNFLLQFSESSIWLYPSVYKFYSFISIIIGFISFMFVI